jgi:LmbE family N-acetylglucosaminyl deacetylase
MESRLKKTIHYLDGVVDTLIHKKIKPYLLESGRECIVFFQKITRSSDISKRKIFADMDTHKKTFELEKKEFISLRNDWLKNHPEYAHPDLSRFDTQEFSGENVLVISPHPDDEIIGCGGTLIKMLKEGVFVSVVQVTDGSNTSALKDSPEHIRKTIRLEEAKDVAKNLGFTELFLFKEPDSHLECTAGTVKKLTDILNRLDPKVIFIPFINDTHPDHIIANEILRKSLEVSSLDLGHVNVLSYEVWNLVPPNSYCTIDNHFDRKAEMLRKYRTAMKLIDYVHFCECLNSYHAYTLFGKKGFIEVFLKLDARTYLELVQKTHVS